MNQTETINAFAMQADISKAAAARVMDAFEARLKTHFDGGQHIAFKGPYRPSGHAQRRNPRTVRTILIPSATVLRFKASKAGIAGAKCSVGSALQRALWSAPQLKQQRPLLAIRFVARHRLRKVRNGTFSAIVVTSPNALQGKEFGRNW